MQLGIISFLEFIVYLMTDKTIKRLNKLYFYFFSVVILSLINYRGLLVDKSIGITTDCIGCYKYWVISVDARIAIVAFIFLFLSVFAKNYFIRLFCRIIFLFYLLYSFTDIYLYKFLNQRLLVSDISLYFDINTILETFNRELSSNSKLYIFLVLMFILQYLTVHKKSILSKIEKLYSLTIVLLLSGLILFVSRIDYINDVAIRNIVEINFQSSSSVDYSDETIRRAKEKIDDIESLQCFENQKSQKSNIILVVWESLSMYQSQLFSGMNNWTPKLDKLARENRYYTNFFANNFTSLEGRLALLTGEKTFRDIAQMTLDRGRVGYWNLKRNVPELFNSNGYHTAFLDGADLGFTNTGDFMQALGYDYVEGEEFNGYKGIPRFGFNSVADDVLYNRVIDYISSVEKPYFLTVITVSTHAPYIDPETRKSSIESSTKYADRSLYEFYKKLQDIEFFEDGILVITSDHRSMTPVSKLEIDKYDNQAVSRIPLVVIGNQTGSAIRSDEYLQQSDLLSSFDYLISDSYCKREDEGNIFSIPAVPSECVYHNRGDFRDIIDVYCDNGMQQAVIKLDGDNTRIISGNLESPEKVIDLINSSRISARKRHEEYTEMISN